MTKTSATIIFFGTENFSAECLQRLIDDGFDIAAAVTKPDYRSGRGKKLTSSPVKQLAIKHNIKVWQPEDLLEIVKNIKAVKNRLGVLVSYGKLVPKEILDLFEPIGIINLHPSLLPKYRGPSPVESAILNGDNVIGISFIKLTENMDAGPIYHQTDYEYDKQENIEDVYEAVSAIGATELTQIVQKAIEGKLPTPRSQDDKQATYCKKISKQDGNIDWQKPAKTLGYEIRAYHKWPKSRTKLGDVEVIITKAHEVPSISGGAGNIKIVHEAKKLLINTSNGCLCIDSIQPIGKKEMPISAFLAGYSDKIKSR